VDLDLQKVGQLLQEGEAEVLLRVRREVHRGEARSGDRNDRLMQRRLVSSARAWPRVRVHQLQRRTKYTLNP
jgi:hypothetical protein